MPYFWNDEAWEDYQYWLGQDRKTVKRVNDLLKELARDGERPHGKAEVLKGTGGLRSVRIDKKNRLIYKPEGDLVRIISLRGHYGEK